MRTRIIITRDYYWLLLIITDYYWLFWYERLLRLWWLSRIIDDYQWLSMIISDFRWLSVIIDDCLWLSMIIRDYQWLSRIIWKYKWLFGETGEIYSYMDESFTTAIPLEKARFLRLSACKVLGRPTRHTCLSSRQPTLSPCQLKVSISRAASVLALSHLRADGCQATGATRPVQDWARTRKRLASLSINFFPRHTLKTIHCGKGRNMAFFIIYGLFS